jgi:streptomycin 6-kinase
LQSALSLPVLCWEGISSLKEQWRDMFALVVPERVRLRAEQSSPETRQWLKDLPGLLSELEHEWELSIGQPLSGGSSAYVAPVTTESGHAIIKIAMPSQHSLYSFQQERDTLLRADGHGYVRVFKFDDERRALLLEPLGPSMHERKVEPKQAILLLCKTLQQAWLVPPGADQTINTLEYKAQTPAQLISELWDKLEQPCSESMVSVALEFARRRLEAFDPHRCVLVHGDPHPANALLVRVPRAGAESGYVFDAVPGLGKMQLAGVGLDGQDLCDLLWRDQCAAGEITCHQKQRATDGVQDFHGRAFPHNGRRTDGEQGRIELLLGDGPLLEGDL